MKGDFIPPEHHVARYCGASHIDPDTGQIGPGAFMLKATDSDGGLSVNWLEYFQNQNLNEQLDSVRRALSQKMALGAKSRLAVLNVDGAIKAVKETGLLISILHDPAERQGSWSDPSHSGVYGLPALPIDKNSAAVALSQAIVSDYQAKK